MTEARRLVYGPADYAGHEGIVVDAAAAARFAALSQATTLSGYVEVMYAGDWEQFIMLELEEGAAASPDDAFDFAEWVNDGSVSEHPADTAWDAASVLVTHFVAADPTGLGGIHCGGGSSGGSMDAISGPLDQLALLAERIDPERDGILLERNDDLVDQGMSKALYA